VPSLRDSSSAVARAALGILAPRQVSWEETAFQIAHLALRLSAGVPRTSAIAGSRVIALATGTARRIERDPADRWTLQQLAADAGLSPFQYLRAFKRATGVTPHQFVLRARLRAAAIGLAMRESRVIDIASTAGFDDLSNFNHAFKAEFGVAPQAYRRGHRTALRA
jgi:AraC-like DNA-binding protein